MFRDATAIWFDYYLACTGERYMFDGKDGKHLKLLLNKIKLKVIEKGMEPTEENILNSFRGFLTAITDKWIFDNLEIAIVNSKFNSLYVKAKQSSPFTRAHGISEIVRAKHGADIKRTA
jgi:hypothetical protein